ncbi:MAG: hypothetical protein KGH72_05300 [Candidatus Micrarchaeota archaeon]|nr:hypothetical protein [Candidatus Micrarchaeota archaeon]
MDLIIKALIVGVVIIAALYGVYYFSNHSFSQTLTQQQAVSLVQHDLQTTYPEAIINITNVTPSEFVGSWHIVASMIFNATTPCPAYYIYSFDYPKYGFVYRLDNNYTANCIVNGLAGNKSYVVASYPVAIARSYSLNLSNVMGYVERYGYSNVNVHAAYYPYTIFNFVNYTKVWIVNYSAPAANYSAYVVLNQNGGSLAAAVNKSH